MIGRAVRTIPGTSGTPTYMVQSAGPTQRKEFLSGQAGNNIVDLPFLSESHKTFLELLQGQQHDVALEGLISPTSMRTANVGTELDTQFPWVNCPIRA